MKNLIQKIVNIFGYKITKLSDPDVIIDNDERFMKIYNKCRNLTMTSKQRMYALYKSIEYIIDSEISGDFVECGVWRGGSTMLIAYSLIELNSLDRKIYLYDTFEGMSKPTDYDRSISNNSNQAIDKWKKEQRENHNDWCFASLSDVENNMYSTNYPKDNIVFVKGKVEDTVPNTDQSIVAVLRLDTDWYESTKHELSHLYPLLSIGGVLIIDDYGSWTGSKKAVDEYFTTKKILLNRIDLPGRIGIKIK